MENCWEQSMPTIKEVKHLLDEAKTLFPGPWIEHSINVGNAAELIAISCPPNKKVIRA